MRASTCWNVDSCPTRGTNCLGMLSRETGHRRVPAPPHMITPSTATTAKPPWYKGQALPRGEFAAPLTVGIAASCWVDIADPLTRCRVPCVFRATLIGSMLACLDREFGVRFVPPSSFVGEHRIVGFFVRRAKNTARDTVNRKISK
jgi:hypothetical protein